MIPPGAPRLLAGGGLSPDGSRWIACKSGFFLPVRVLSGRGRARPAAAPRAPFAQQIEQLRRKHHVAVPLPLALLDPQSVSVRWLSISDTLRFATSDTRRPAP